MLLGPVMRWALRDVAPPPAPLVATVDWRTWTLLGAMGLGLGVLVYRAAKQPRERHNPVAWGPRNDPA